MIEESWVDQLISRVGQHALSKEELANWQRLERITKEIMLILKVSRRQLDENGDALIQAVRQLLKKKEELENVARNQNYDGRGSEII